MCLDLKKTDINLWISQRLVEFEFCVNASAREVQGLRKRSTSRSLRREFASRAVRLDGDGWHTFPAWMRWVLRVALVTRGEEYTCVGRYIYRLRSLGTKVWNVPDIYIQRVCDCERIWAKWLCQYFWFLPFMTLSLWRVCCGAGELGVVL